MYDVIVVGGGVIGLSTARYLSRCGSKTLLIDQFSLPHSYGSSHGKSRGIRYTYKTFHHVEMMPEAFEEWKKLENETKSKLLIKCGIVCLCDDNESNAMAHNMNRVNVDCKILSSDEIENRFPSFITDGMDGIYDPEAGILRADDCLWALKASYMLAGGEIEQGTVVKIEPIDQQTVNIHTNDQVYVAKSVVLTCGPWINDLLKPIQLQLPISVKRSLIIYWKTQKPSSYLCGQFPLTCVSKPSDLIYTVPVCEFPGYVKKTKRIYEKRFRRKASNIRRKPTEFVRKSCYTTSNDNEVIGIHEGLSLDHPSNRDSSLNEDDEKLHNGIIEKFKTLVKIHYPEVVAEPRFTQTCMYSVTPDEDFILDFHPSYSNIIIGAGFSGHGFKLAPVIGSILGKLVLGKEQTYSLQPFLLSRFKSHSV